jgi:hypothetical protein
MQAMTPKDLLLDGIDPALRLLNVHGIKPSDNARVLELAIAGQETQWKDRRQLGGGPARSLWQFEGGPLSALGGLFRLVPDKLSTVCDKLSIPCERAVVFEAMAWNDVLAASCARLLLWTDPAPLPDATNVEGGWQYYLRLWQPGLPHRATWDARHATAREVVKQCPL